MIKLLYYAILCYKGIGKPADMYIYNILHMHAHTLSVHRAVFVLGERYISFTGHSYGN